MAKAVAMAASTALPPRLRTASPTSVPAGETVTTIPLRPPIAGPFAQAAGVSQPAQRAPPTRTRKKEEDDRHRPPARRRVRSMRVPQERVDEKSNLFKHLSDRLLCGQGNRTR